MRSLYESLLDDDDVVLKRAGDNMLIVALDEMLKSRKPNSELIKQLESKVAIYKVNNHRDLSDLISKYTELVGNNCSLNWIDVSNIKDMSFVFYNSNFNGDISKWDVSKVENMSCIFCNSKFNKDISKWDVSNVKNYTLIFKNCPIKEEYKPKFK